jgi:hypothetical protein
LPNLTIEQRRLLGRTKVLGGQIPLELSDAEILEVIAVIFSDNDRRDLCERVGKPAAFGQDYFERPLQEFIDAAASPMSLEDAFILGSEEVSDFATYLQCLSEIHKRRRKYARILERQPFPTDVQVAPRALLEFGLVEDEALASWMAWRKWMFDIDNRAGQETGYMFEPLLAHALGGEPYPAQKSPIRRHNDKSKGRQVDCLVDRDAYEFKLRVTIAASGQGRFSEELDFPVDCKACGYKPILVVLDPTPNPRLSDLIAAFAENGGMSFVGDDAWAHLESRAGGTMARFLERYVRKPLATAALGSSEPLDLQLHKKADKAVVITLSNTARSFERTVVRAPDPTLEDDPGEDE